MKPRSLVTWSALLIALVAACSARDGAPSQAAAAASTERRVPGDLALDGGLLEVRFDGERDREIERRAERWIRRAAEAVSAYYGRFPVARARLAVHLYQGRGIGGGRVVVTDLPTIHIALGRYSEPVDFERDWRLTHEMVHLGFPRVDQRHHWIEEGLATYVEPVARAQSGWLSDEEVFAEWLDHMEQGQPRPGDRGLDRTPTWARTYWGGALFALAADVEIRARTHDRRGLRDALRGILASGGSISSTWPLARALAAGDRATGVAVLAESYQRMATRPAAVDLERLWRQLGIRRDRDRVVVDPDPAKAALRRAILHGR